MSREELPKPQGVCPYCGKEVYIDLEKHILICKLEPKFTH